MRKIIFSLTMLAFTGLSQRANAQTIIDNGTCGSSLTWTLTSDSVLTISGSGDMDNYQAYNAPWHDNYNRQLKTIVINNGVTSIGEYAFADCYASLITISNSVVRIGSYAFYYYGQLTSITIPNSVTSIGNRAFWGNFSSINVDVNNNYYSSTDGILYSKLQDTLIQCPYNKTGAVIIPSSVKHVGECAFWSSKLTSITIPQGVISIGVASFASCGGLVSITIPNSVLCIEGTAFESCNNLTSITIPNSVTRIDFAAFRYCRRVSSVIIGNSLTSIGEQLFSGCNSLKSVTIPNNITGIGRYAFDYCDSLKSVTIPNSINAIGEYAFRNCNRLTDVYVSWTTPFSVFSNIFYNVSTTNVNLHVPVGTASLYAATPVWQNFNIVTNIISGMVMSSDSITPLNAGRAFLYKIQSGGGKYPCIDTVPITNGRYMFPQVDSGDYYVCAKADVLECTLPTYYGNTEIWDSATIVRVENGISLDTIDMTIIPCAPAMTGNSSIFGRVVRVDGKNQKGVNPESSADVFLDKSESKDKWHTVAQTITDTAGSFSFGNVDSGAYYRVRLGIPGMTIDTTLDNPIAARDTLEVELVIREKDYSIRILEETKIKVYPNPTNAILHIVSDETLHATSVQIYNIVGQSVYVGAGSACPNATDGTTTIDISHLANGLYFLKIGKKTIKIIKY